MLNRRSFLTSSLGLAVGASHARANEGLFLGSEANTWNREYERILAHTDQMHLLGHPRSWSVVRDGFHPFAPERVVILNRRDLGSPHGIREKLGRKIVEGLAGEKLDLLTTVMKLLTDFYRVPQFFEDWAHRLAHREQLGSTGIGRGLGLIHQFQAWGQTVPTVVNPPVDWWLFLIPKGMDYESLDDRPVFALIGHVLSAGGYDLGPLWLSGTMQKSEMSRVASMDRVSAARFLNVQLALALEEARLKGSST